MKRSALSRVTCPACGSGDLGATRFGKGEFGGENGGATRFGEGDPDEITTGVVDCRSCSRWYPIEGGLLDLLIGELAYADDRERFFDRHRERLEALGLARDDASAEPGEQALQTVQQNHFDWYADNDTQSYAAYEQLPFWRAVDALTFGPWRREMRPGGCLLDVGCAQGRSTFKLLDLDLDVVAFDVSKRSLEQAVAKYLAGDYRARASFIAADASRFPFADGAFDYVLVYGVIHHLPDPPTACREVARVLAPDGVYFGSENNRTIFRAVFDLLQKISPLWHEEAGPEPLISGRDLSRWFADTGVAVTTRSSVFLPPHVVNWTKGAASVRLLGAFDHLARALPGLGRQGGLILIRGQKG